MKFTFFVTVIALLAVCKSYPDFYRDALFNNLAVKSEVMEGAKTLTSERVELANAKATIVAFVRQHVDAETVARTLPSIVKLTNQAQAALKLTTFHIFIAVSKDSGVRGYELSLMREESFMTARLTSAHFEVEQFSKELIHVESYFSDLGFPFKTLEISRQVSKGEKEVFDAMKFELLNAAHETMPEHPLLAAGALKKGKFNFADAAGGVDTALDLYTKAATAFKTTTSSVIKSQAKGKGYDKLTLNKRILRSIGVPNSAFSRYIAAWV